jgi:predicted nucleic acid-binding protein
MTSLRFVDTSILIYYISSDPSEPRIDRAFALIDAGSNSLSVQVLQEFYVQATWPTWSDSLPQDRSVADLQVSVPIMTGALEITEAHRLSYKDAAIVSAARTLGCQKLFSEAMAGGRGRQR